MIPITVQAPGLADRNLLQKPGGFIWWYLDLVEENGDGFVLIFAWGLPFLPGLLHAARQGKPQMPGEWPAVSLAVYRGGTCVFYLLDVPETASWDQTRTRESLAFGRSTMTLGWESGRFELQVNLDTEGAGEPISGQICVTGPGVQSETAPTAHSWAVLAACVSGQATLKIAGEQWLFSGRAYVDRNAGDRPIDTLGMSAWTWARVAFPGRELVLWEVDGTTPGEQTIALSIFPDGSRALDSPRYESSGRWWGAGTAAPKQIQVQGAGWPASLRLGRPLESSPFYARFPVTAVDVNGEVGHGFAERCLPARIDATWMRPLVRMVVQRPQSRSRWLPLVAGPREGRVRRLLRSWF